MKKFKKFYIALLGGILALGVGTGSLVSSVRPSAVEAAEAVFTVDFANIPDYYRVDGGGISGYPITSDYITVTAQRSFGSEPLYYYSGGYIQLYAGNQFHVSTSEGTISQITFTFNTGSTASDYFTESYYAYESYHPSTSYSVSGNTLYFENVTSLYVYVKSQVQIKQIDVTLTGVTESDTPSTPSTPEESYGIPDDAHIVNFRYLQINNGYDFMSSLTSGYITVSANDGTGNDVPRYYTSGYIALSAGNQFQISTSAGKITKIYFILTSTDYSVSNFSSSSSITISNNIISCDGLTSLTLVPSDYIQISQIGVILTDLPEKAVVEKTIDISLANVPGDHDTAITRDLEFGYITLHHDGYYSYPFNMSSYLQYSRNTYFNISTSLGVISKIQFNFNSGSVSNFASYIAFSADTDTNTLTFIGQESISLYTTSRIEIYDITVTLELTPLEEAIYWADSFNSGITCDNSGLTEPTGDWNEFASSYNALSDEAKAYFEDDREENQSTIIEEAIKKYDYIVTKYKNTGRYNSFINRTPVVNSANTISSVTNNVDYITIIAIVISVLALTSIAAFIIIYRKRKLSSK